MTENSPIDQTGTEKILAVAKRIPWSPDKWRISVSVCIIVLMGDHLGSWDMDGIFAGGDITVKEIVALIAGAGAIYNSFFKH